MIKILLIYPLKRLSNMVVILVGITSTKPLVHPRVSQKSTLSIVVQMNVLV